MPTDVAFPFDFDETGDAATVSGQSFYEQHAQLLSLIVVEDRLGEPLTANDLVEIESQIERQFTRSPYFSAPTVAVTDRADERVDIAVDIAETSTFTVPVERPDRATL